MKPLFYVDYQVNVGMKADMGEVAQAASRLFRALHAGFSEFQGLFALDLPSIGLDNPISRLRKMRVFSESAEDHAKLASFLENSGYDNLFSSSSVKSVPDLFDGQYRVLRRIRIRSRERGIQRIKTMKELEKNGNIWLTIKSSENKNHFRFYFEAHVVDGPPRESGEPSNYGLSIGETPVYLPVI